MNKDEEYSLHTGDNNIGRSDSNDICVLDKKSSRAHCKLVLDKKDMKLVDLNSTNGVRVNNTFVEGECPLENGDHIRIGQTVYLVSERDSNDAEACMSASAKVRKQKKYNNLLQQTSFHMTQTSNLRKMKAESEEKETGFLAYFKKEDPSEE